MLKHPRIRQTGSEAVLVFVMALAFLFVLGPVLSAVADDNLNQKVKSRDTSFYRDFFDSVFYKPFAGFLRMDDMLVRAKVSRREAQDINQFDEVPDSSFFVNRQGREPLSVQAMVQGPSKGPAPDIQGPWTVTKGKVEGVSTGFFIKDQKGDAYLLKFDPKENPEMATAAEIIGHKFFYAFGYNVPEYYLVSFAPEILAPDPKATYYDDNGFKRSLDQAALQELIARIPKFKEGKLRASASKMISGIRKGYMDFDGRRTSDPEDLIPHENRRSIRALRVFGSWLNHYDLRKGNTMDALVEENGKTYIKHYLIDFGSTLGSAAYRPKVPVAGYEHIFDWLEVGMAVPTFKWKEKEWEERWDKANRKVEHPAIGFFDNNNFDPGEWKSQLTYEAFDRLTLGDAFWASKIIMTITDEDIRAVVATGEYSDAQDQELITQVLIVRRDMIGQYWFDRVTPLDEIKLFKTSDNKYEIRFVDLSVKYRFAKAEETTYRYDTVVKNRSKVIRRTGFQEFSSPSLSLDLAGIGPAEHVVVFIEAKRSGKAWNGHPLEVKLVRSESSASWEIAGIDHGI